MESPVHHYDSSASHKAQENPQADLSVIGVSLPKPKKPGRKPRAPKRPQPPAVRFMNSNKRRRGKRG